MLSCCQGWHKDNAYSTTIIVYLLLFKFRCNLSLFTIVKQNLLYAEIQATNIAPFESACSTCWFPTAWVGFANTSCIDPSLVVIFLDIAAGEEMPSDEYFAPGTGAFEDGSFQGDSQSVACVVRVDGHTEEHIYFATLIPLLLNSFIWPVGPIYDV